MVGVDSHSQGGTAPGPAAEVGPTAPRTAFPRLVSIIICTKDRRDDLARALTSVAACGPEARETEIVIVEETDAPHPVPGTTYVAIPRAGRGFGYARNQGVAAARGDILVFLDDDCQAQTGWLRALVAPFAEDPSIAGAAGAVLVRDCNAIGYAENILGFPGGGLRYLAAAGGRARETRYLSTCNCAYRRAAVEAAGKFLPAAVWGGEDALLAERVTAKGRCVYVPDAVVFHRPRGSLAGVFRWFVRRGHSEIQIFPHRTRLRATALKLVWTSITLRAIVLAAALSFLPLPLAASVSALAVAYYGLGLWRYRFALRFPGYRLAWTLVPVVKLVMDLGMEAGKLMELASPLGRAGRRRCER